jgi:hypothetical protein
MKRGKGARPLLAFEIKDAQSKARSAAEAARVLDVSYNTYVKYAKMYDLHEGFKNQEGVGISKGFAFSGGRYSLDDLIRGKYPNYPPASLRDRLIGAGYIPERCDSCGFDESRVTDDRVPLQLNFKDGNSHNHLFDNLELLCYNCYFLQVGNLIGKQKDMLY